MLRSAGSRLPVSERKYPDLVGTAQHGVRGQIGSGPEGGDGVHVEHIAKLIVIPGFNILHLVGGAEPVEKMQERHAAFDACQMCYRGKVHDFLRIGRGKLGKAGGAAGHNVALIAEYRKRVCRQSACGAMNYAGQHFARDLIHVRNHQQQTLRSREGGCKRAGYEAAVHRARGASLRLHFYNADSLIKYVFTAFGRPLVDKFGHGR